MFYSFNHGFSKPNVHLCWYADCHIEWKGNDLFVAALYVEPDVIRQAVQITGDVNLRGAILFAPIWPETAV